ncbi:MAG: deoxyhypusine synthase [Thaumarchaeota archaeon]|nr:MAG: deoxyhypusine synthase [Nitrososphaerota archaeon]
MDPVRDIKLWPKMRVSELLDQFERSGGFGAKYLGTASKIFLEMLKDDECFRFLSFVAAPIATGFRGVIAEAIKRKMFHAIITTCGTLDHDIARVFGEYYSGDFKLDDVKLRRDGYHRLGSVVVPLESYGPTIEKFVQECLEEAYSNGVREVGSYEISRILGEKLKDENSILYLAARNGVEIFVPGIMDGAVGTQLWLFQQKRRDFKLNLFRDSERLSEIVFKAKRTGAIMIGGGISKHHTLWWNQFKDGLDYAIYITTACEYDGSLSGALVSEAISWGKVKPEAKRVTVHGDATIIFPILLASVLDYL